MRFGSLFAGIGGFDLGLERAGMECAWQVEIDDFCQKVLTKHWPDVPKYKDVRDVGSRNLESVDLVCGGFPCQPFSTAGKQRGTKDDRHLWPEMLRIISELKPTWVIGENVPGIISIFLDQAIIDLEAEGYTCETFVLPAIAFDAPHRRDRLFIVAHSDKIRCLQCDESEKSSQGETCGKSNTRSLGNSESQSSDVGNNQSSKGESQISKPGDSGCKRNAAGLPRWVPEPEMDRVAYGIPDRVDRLRGLGNAVVPQVAEWIGHRIMEAIK